MISDILTYYLSPTISNKYIDLLKRERESERGSWLAYVCLLVDLDQGCDVEYRSIGETTTLGG